MNPTQEIELDRLYDWYSLNHRKLPFRQTRDPYSIWVSEIMLQQTRVAAMLPRYTAFMKAFPNIESLAQASEEEVVQAWQGLGYYSRARNLRKGAQQITESMGGSFPRILSDALKLSGVGPYTAAAVLSIAYDQAVPVVDGNVERVLSRLFYPGANGRVWFRDTAERLIAGATNPSLHNQSIMELGALICVPGKPFCEVCPVQTSCAVFKAGGPQKARSVPAPKREERVDVVWRFVAFTPDTEYFLVLKDPEVPFLKGHWLFPSTLSLPGRPGYASPGIEKLKGIETDPAIQSIRHSITKHNIRAELDVRETADALLCKLMQKPEVSRKPNDNGAEWRMVRRGELKDVMASSLSLKLIQLLDTPASYRKS
ncbi:MAG: A/G-specific adenine glycosylase [Spirochaetia bacterium]|nr:A/G-specific adenine glycosylase [Spirochaetia bacterium]